MLTQSLNLIAGGAISKGNLLKMDSTNPEKEVIVTSASTSVPVAVALNDVAATDSSSSLQYVGLVIGHLYDLVAAAAVAKNALLMPAASGRVATATATNHAHFVAVEAASAAGKRFQARYIGPTYVAS